MVVAYLMTQFMVASIQEKFGPSPVLFISGLIDSFPQEQRLHVMESLQSSAKDATLMRRYQLVSEDGNILFPKGTQLNFDWAKLKKPEQPHSKVIGGSRERYNTSGYEVAKLDGQPPQYLVMTFTGATKDDKWVFLGSLAIYLGSLFFGMAVAIFLIFRTMKEKVELADSVISELQRGNLKVRFPITKLDEIGQVMSRFNKMADEIERLVDQLRSVELTRIKLLQELAHDLRTPVASLKNLTETVHIKGDSLSPQLRGELIALSLKEINYFEQLVEDLLVLAQVSEPRYHLNQVSTPIMDLIEEESLSAQKKQGEKDLKFKFDESFSQKNIEVIGDPHLLRRLLRNSFENAFSYAESEVSVRMYQENPREIEIVMEDDGPGFSSDVLRTFGERRVSRVLGASAGQGGRLSVGLGSVIMKAIVDVHRGSLFVSNRSDGQHGARVTLRLPI